MRRTIVGLLALPLLWAVARAQPPGDKSEGEAALILERERWFYDQRRDEQGRIDRARRLRALQRVLASVQPRGLTPNWRSAGPSPIVCGPTYGFGRAAGRIAALAVDPNDADVIYAAAATGGVWKTTDGGLSWSTSTDQMPSLAMGALAIDPFDSNVVYAGTGESATNEFDNYLGAGLYKSTDAGATWTVSNGPGDQLDATWIADVIVSPTSSSTIWVAGYAASDGATVGPGGIYRSTDGGAHWTKTLSGYATSLVAHPSDGLTLWAGLGRINGDGSNGVWKSTNGGVSWSDASSGISTTRRGRLELALARTNPQILWAGVVSSLAIGSLQGVYKSVNGAASWTEVTNAPSYCSGQCWYDNYIEISPFASVHVYLGGILLYRTLDGGNTWSGSLIGSWPSETVHQDLHAQVWHPTDFSVIFVGTDGGVWKSIDRANTLDGWIPLNYDLTLTQFVGVGIHPTDDGILLGGSQDNATALRSGAPEWLTSNYAGDGGVALIDHTNPEIMFSYYPGLLYRSTNGGVNWTVVTSGFGGLFYAPYTMDPVDSQRLYLGGRTIYRSTSGGALGTWASVGPNLGSDSVSAVEVAPAEPQRVYFGTTNGQVWRSDSGGDSGTWVDLTAAPLPAGVGRWASDFTMDPADPEAVLVAYNRYSSSGGHVFYSADGGASWTDVSGDLPDVPVNALLWLPTSPPAILAGTDAGVFITEDLAEWVPFNGGLPPAAIVTDLRYNAATQTVTAATYGRGAWQYTLGGAILAGPGSGMSMVRVYQR